MSIRQELAHFSAQLSFEALPRDVVQYTKYCFMDQVGNMIPGPRDYLEDHPDIALFMKDLGGKKESTILGASGKYPCLHAALVNAAIGSTGFCAVHKKTVIHIPEVLFPAAIAVAEREKSTGQDLILAIVLGAEIMTRVGIALGAQNTYVRGFHPTSVCAPLGCAMAAGKLLGLGETQLAEALSIAAIQAAGSPIFWAGPGLRAASYCLQVGRAAQNGILAAMLAQIGFNGVDQIFEDARGFAKAHSVNPDLSQLTAELGERWEIKGLILKRFGFGNLGLSSIDTLLEMLEKYEIDPDEIEEIIASFPTVIAPLICHAEYPKNRFAALINYKYVLAVNAYMGRSALYNPELSGAQCRRDPRVIRLFDRIRAVGDPVLDEIFPEKEPCILTIKMKNGRQFTKRNDGPAKGDPEDPLSEEEIETKFKVLTTPFLGERKARQLADRIKGLDQLRDISKMVKLWAV